MTASKMDARELAKVAQACLCLHCLCRCGKCLIATWVALEGVRLLVASGIDCDHDGFISSNDMEDFQTGETDVMCFTCSSGRGFETSCQMCCSRRYHMLVDGLPRRLRFTMHALLAKLWSLSSFQVFTQRLSNASVVLQRVSRDQVPPLSWLSARSLKV